MNSPLFVTWKKKMPDYQLRGCLGNFKPMELHVGLKEYALLSAFSDSRFSPIESHELSQLQASVSLLIEFEKVEKMDWEIGQHGVWIEVFFLLSLITILV